MTKEDKELLLTDLSARLPYMVKCQFEDTIRLIDGEGEPFYDYTLSARHLDLFINHENFYIKPYLRPISSMTEEEVDEFTQFDVYANGEYIISNYKIIDWLNKQHFDYRTDDEGKTMIEKGLALKAPEGMYNNKEEKQ